MRRTSCFIALACACAFACGDTGADGGAAGSTSASGGAGGEGGTGGVACDPRPTSGAGAGGSPSSMGGSTGAIVISGSGGGVELGGGMPFPEARLKCWSEDENGPSGFMCEQYDKECCVKKDVCFDPVTEPTFCDRPYCE